MDFEKKKPFPLKRKEEKYRRISIIKGGFMKV